MPPLSEARVSLNVAIDHHDQIALLRTDDVHAVGETFAVINQVGPCGALLVVIHYRLLRQRERDARRNYANGQQRQHPCVAKRGKRPPGAAVE